jgi:hypothetical protein
MATAVSSAARGWRILFFPESPSPKTMLSKLCLYAAHRVVTSPDEFHDAAIKWWDDTYAANTTLPATFVAKAGVLNLACEDISKSRVDQVFADIFGYGLTVDPTRYVGPYVEKSEANASHDGRILDRPLMTPRPGRVYQRLVDNTVPGGAVEDIRVPIYGDAIPYVYLKTRPLGERFKNVLTTVRLAEAGAILTPVEREKTIAVVQRMGVDYGELDVLRDRNDGRLYVVDVNPTPFAGSLGRLPPSEQAEALRRESACFVDLLRAKRSTRYPVTTSLAKSPESGLTPPGKW